MPDPGQGAPLLPVAPVRWATRQRWRPSIGGPLPLPFPWTIARDRRPAARRVAGRVWLPGQHAETPIVYPIILRASDPQPRRRRVAGSVWSPRNQGETPRLDCSAPIIHDRQPRRRRIAGLVWLPRNSGETPVCHPYSVLRVVGLRYPRRGSTWIGRLLNLPPIPFVSPPRLARDPQSRRRWLPGFAWLARFASPGVAAGPTALVTDSRLATQVAISQTETGIAQSDPNSATIFAVTAPDVSTVQTDPGSATAFAVSLPDTSTAQTDPGSAYQLAM